MTNFLFLYKSLDFSNCPFGNLHCAQPAYFYNVALLFMKSFLETAFQLPYCPARAQMLQECAITPSSLAYRRVDSCNTALSQYDTEKAAGTSGIPPRKENLSLSLPESTRPSF